MFPSSVTAATVICPQGCFLPDVSKLHKIFNLQKPALLLGLALFSAPALAISHISIDAEKVETSQGELRNARLDLNLQTFAVNLKSQFRQSPEHEWTDASLNCARLLNPKKGSWQCDSGKLAAGMTNLPFSLRVDTQSLKGMQQIDAQLAVQKASFSDAAGLHAGENVTAKLRLKAGQLKASQLKASQFKQGWSWQFDLDWSGGEVFWQPFYIALSNSRPGSHQLRGKGTFNEQLIKVEEARLTLQDIGSADASAEIWRAGTRIRNLQVATGTVDLETLYPLILKPLLEKTALSNLEIAGTGDLKLSMLDGEIKTAHLNLQQVDVEDRNSHFALYKLNADLPWDYDQAKPVQLAYEGGHLLKLPLGKTDIKAMLNRYSLTAQEIDLPLLDGGLNLRDISAVWVDKGWHWHLRAEVVPISMTDLSHALSWPAMQGKVSASIPLVTYSQGVLMTEGDLRFKLFDGTIDVSKLTMRTPLGIAPRLNADIHMRNLDLGTLTRTFSFGAIEGKLDGDVTNLRLANWKPVNFDAALYSSPGKYPKKISQRAVENISSLGGASAAAAIQRSFLRFFDQFNYAKLGLSCKLRGDYCAMDGIESTGDAYVIVKGSGIPSITVLGYNRNVSWGELLERLKRVTAGNSKPIIE